MACSMHCLHVDYVSRLQSMCMCEHATPLPLHLWQRGQHALVCKE